MPGRELHGGLPPQPAARQDVTFDHADCIVRKASQRPRLHWLPRELPSGMSRARPLSCRSDTTGAAFRCFLLHLSELRRRFLPTLYLVHVHTPSDCRYGWNPVGGDWRSKGSRGAGCSGLRSALQGILRRGPRATPATSERIEEPLL